VIDSTFQFYQSKQQLRKLFQSGSPDCRVVKIRKNSPVYASGERDAMIYCVVSGQIKEVLISPEGKECLLAIHTAGDILGELCLCGQERRLETSTAMRDSLLTRIPGRVFLSMLRRESQMESLVQYLASRIAEQKEVITTLLTVNSEQRLAKTLLRLATNLGMENAGSKRIIQRIRHEELAEMVGTTRSRIGVFLKKFRGLGLIDLDKDRCLLVNERGLEQFIEGFESQYEKETGGFQAPDLNVRNAPNLSSPQLCQTTGVA
jgi:CRP-like cAMP-binding protein